MLAFVRERRAVESCSWMESRTPGPGRCTHPVQSRISENKENSSYMDKVATVILWRRNGNTIICMLNMHICNCHHFTIT